MLEKRVQNLIKATQSTSEDCQPVFYRLTDDANLKSFNELLSGGNEIKVHDTIHSQLCELIKSRVPNAVYTAEKLNDAIEQHLNGIGLFNYGVWVYYRWSGRVVHILDEDEFIEIRTNRNKYKITGEEQKLLSNKKLGVIGLSVGQSVSLTIAMERLTGELRIADYDHLEITNLNRLRSGLHNMGLKKTVMVAREIAELDPFLKVTCFHEGITEENIESFLLDNGKLDILIDECDSVDVKINCRVVAKRHNIPVVMEASDRGTIDIERFDLEPERPLLHGYIEHLDITKLKGLKTSEEKLPYILPIAGIDTMSVRMKASAVEVGRTISTWPQLASAVTMGGGITADVCRRILLGQLHISGRFFIDIEEIIGDPKMEEKPMELPTVEPLTTQKMEGIISRLPVDLCEIADIGISKIYELVTAAIKAPSAGNMQPWKWYYAGNRLYLFHDEERSASFGDFNHMGAYLSIGTAVEHIYLKAAQLNLKVLCSLFPIKDSELAASFSFSPSHNITEDLLVEYFDYRVTNRNQGNCNKIPDEIIQELKITASKIPKATLKIIEDRNSIELLAKIAGKADKLRIFIEEGHFDLFNRELKFSIEDPEKIKEGLDIRALDLSPKDQVGFRVIKDLKAIRLISEWNGGSALEVVSYEQMASASAVGVIVMPEFSPENIVLAGRAIERVWLQATANGISFQPLLASVLHFARINHGNGEGIPKKIKNEFSLLQEEFNRVFVIDKTVENSMFLFRLCYAPPPKLKAQRLGIEELFIRK